MGEEDVLFERTVQMKGRVGHCILLEEGVRRYVSRSHVVRTVELRLNLGDHRFEFHHRHPS